MRTEGAGIRAISPKQEVRANHNARTSSALSDDAVALTDDVQIVVLFQSGCLVFKLVSQIQRELMNNPMTKSCISSVLEK